MVLSETLLHHFQTLGVEVEDETFLNKCMDLCDLYNVTEEQLVEMWVAFMVAKNANLEPSLDTLGQLERSVLKKENKSLLDTATAKKDASLFAGAASPRVDHNFLESEDILEMYGYKGSVTPTVKRVRSPDAPDNSVAQKSKIRALTTTFSPSSYGKKTDSPRRIFGNEASGKVLQKFGQEVLEWKSSSSWEVAVRRTKDPHVPAQVMYMFELLSKKSKLMRRVVREYGARISSTWCKISGKDAPPLISNVKHVSQTNFRTFGRILCEMDGKLNQTAIILEGCKPSVRTELPMTVSLELSNIKSYSIFPGQILAVEGTNPTGSELIAQKIFSSGYMEPSPSPKIDENLQIFIASGPFTISEELDYKPLFQLMDHVSNIEPHVLILVGPFVPDTNKEIEDATIVDTFQEVFEQLVRKIMDFVRGKRTRVVLVSSSRDAHHDTIYPTPEFFLPKSMLEPNLCLMPDPCMLDIEGLIIGVTSVDIIRHMSGEEVSANMVGMDRMSRLADHLLAQGCFYPLYPPADEVHIDTALWEKYAFMYQQPHILVLPSDMRYFSKWTHDCFVLNPERVHKHTYARINVRPNSAGAWSKDQIDCEILKV